MTNVRKEEFFYWLGRECLEPSWLTDVMIDIINEKEDQQSMGELRSEIKLAFKDSKEA